MRPESTSREEEKILDRLNKYTGLDGTVASLGLSATRTYIEEPELLPTKKFKVEAKDQYGNRVYLIRAIARDKIYRCICLDWIEIGEEHVLAHLEKSRNGYNHHHFHSFCVQKYILPQLQEARYIQSDQSTPIFVRKTRSKRKKRQTSY